MSGAGASAGSCPARLPLSVWVSLHSPRAIISGSLYGLLTRFRAITLPGVRFALVWPSTGRTVRLVGLWRLLCCGCDALACGLGFFVGVQKSTPGRECGRGAHSFCCALRAPGAR